MSWDKTYSHEFLLALDLWAAAIFFNRVGITISTMAGLVRDGKDSPLKLWAWQRAFLAWLEPKLSNAHCERARAADRERAQWVVQVLD